VFVNLSKILTALTNPLCAALILLALAFLLRRRRAARILGFAAVLLLAILGSRPVSEGLAASIEQQNPDRGIPGLPQAQAIVVLGGAIHAPGGQHASSRLLDPSDRLLLAFRLYRAGKAPLVVCSGGIIKMLAGAGERPEAEVMSALLQEWGVPPGAILNESGSENTRENATLSYEMLRPKGIQRILLVTSALHMPRAAAVFRKAGFDVIPAPADFRSGWAEANALNWIPNASYVARSESALHEWLGLWVYRAMGWA
jgi:uncharacterized SAM-binding protein YcdF (DUF218 family)